MARPNWDITMAMVSRGLVFASVLMVSLLGWATFHFLSQSKESVCKTLLHMLDACRHLQNLINIASNGTDILISTLLRMTLIFTIDHEENWLGEKLDNVMPFGFPFERLCGKESFEPTLAALHYVHLWGALTCKLHWNSVLFSNGLISFRAFISTISFRTESIVEFDMFSMQ